jgi:hypothetical protein
MVWFFAGGEAGNNKFNLFTGSFIRLMKEILHDEFDLIKGTYFKSPMLCVIWALNNAQKPMAYPGKERFIKTALSQVMEKITPETQLVLVSSSYGSVVAAQFACFLAELNSVNKFLSKPFHIALGSSIVSKESELYKRIEDLNKEGKIGKLIYDDLQDPGDSSTGVCGRTRSEAWINAFGIIMPWFSKKFSGPSFLNTNSATGHLHRRRSKTLQKALDFIDVMLIKNNLAGDFYNRRAKLVIEQEIISNSRELSSG